MAVDSNGNEYDPDAGSTTPTDGHYCNWPLTNYEERYGEIRFCQRKIPWQADYCKTHRGLAEGSEMRAQELFQHGLFCESIDHVYERLDGWQAAMAWGCFEVLLEDSKYEFGVEYEPWNIEFETVADLPTIPEGHEDAIVFDDDGDPLPELVIEVPRPSEQGDRAVHLWIAAVMSVMELEVQSIVQAEKMRTESREYAEFTTDVVPSENGGEVKSWQTLEGYEEHYLNLPLSRMMKDRKELLKYGGIEIDGETNEAGQGIELSEFTAMGVDSSMVDSTADEVIADTDTDLEELVSSSSSRSDS